ncbi:MAG: hypothetical protein ACJAVI_002989 [Candidatus Azotimanducaceae bacterium]|jgi:hypothetical protein
MTFALFPPVKKIRMRKSTFSLASRRYIVLTNPCSHQLLASIERFQSLLPFETEITFGNPKPTSTLLWIKNPISAPHNSSKRSSVKLTADSKDNYELLCQADALTITAATEKAIYCGLQTLAQVFEDIQWRSTMQSAKQSETSTPTSLPCFTITDWPDFKARGVMLDISRTKVPTMETLLSLIEQLAALKYNQLQLYTEHTFAFSNHEQVWRDASPYTAADIMRVRKFCEDRFIDLVPNLNSFGHMERWLRHSEYEHLAECPNGFIHPFGGKKIPFGSTLKPNAASIKLLQELYDEYLPLFDSQYFNIGGDEPWELGEGWSKSKCEKLGTTNVYIDFLSKIKKQVNQRDHKMMFWSDIVLKEPECLKKLSKNLVALNWGYEGNHPFAHECKAMAAQKIPFYVCPGTSSWNSITGRTTNMQTNLASAARQGKKYGADGYLVTDWGDHGHHQYLPISYAGFLLGACHAWNHQGTGKVDPILGINRSFLDDKTGKTGEILWKMGLVMDKAPSKLRNQTIFNQLLFWNMQQEPSTVEDIPDAQLELCESELLHLEEQIPQIAPSAGKELLQSELGNAIALARHGIHRLQVQRGAQLNHSDLKKNLKKAIKTHKTVWKTRNRVGGLTESCDHLEQSLRALK